MPDQRGDLQLMVINVLAAMMTAWHHDGKLAQLPYPRDMVGNLEDFATTVDGRPLTETDRNFWGVTFVDETFFATAVSTSAGKTWLVKGSASERTMTSIRTDAECP